MASTRRSPTPRSSLKDFATGGARGRLQPGSDVTWDFHDFPGALQVGATVVLDAAIRDRRAALGLSIEEAAVTAGQVDGKPLDH